MGQTVWNYWPWQAPENQMPPPFPDLFYVREPAYDLKRLLPSCVLAVTHNKATTTEMTSRVKEEGTGEAPAHCVTVSDATLAFFPSVSSSPKSVSRIVVSFAIKRSTIQRMKRGSWKASLTFAQPRFKNNRRCGAAVTFRGTWRLRTWHHTRICLLCFFEGGGGLVNGNQAKKNKKKKTQNQKDHG